MANTPGKGTVLQISIASVFTTIVQGVEIVAPAMENPQIDATILTDTWRNFIASIPDGGEVTFKGNFDPAGTTHQKLMTDFTAGAVGSYKILLADPGAAEIAFSALIVNQNIGSATVDSLVMIEVTLKVTGAVTITP